MRLSGLLNPKLIRCGLAAKTKEEALREMVDLVAAATPGIPSADLLAALAEREKQGPFSMGKGSAFPHARTEKVGDFVIALGTSRQGLDFRAPDGRAIHIVVLFVIPRKHSNLYLHTLAAFLSFFQVEDHVKRVLETASPEALVALIDELGPKPKETPSDRLPFQPVAVVHLDTPIGHVSERLRISGLNALPVVDTAGDLLGEVRAEVLLSVLLDKSLKTTVPLSGFPNLLVRNGLPGLQETDSPEEAARRLASTSAAYAYVLRGRRLLGRIAARDLLKP